MSQKKQLRCALYARYSTSNQNEESIEDQFAQCEKVATREGAKIIHRFSDKEKSGGTSNRAGYQALLAAARRREIDIIVAEDISRLWRNRKDYGNDSTEWEDLKVHLVTAVGNDTRKSGWDATIGLYMQMAEQARKEASYRTRRGLEGKAKNGTSTGGKAYGYKKAGKENGHRTVSESEATVVRRIFEMRASGLSALTIARRLNDEKVPSPGATWDRKAEGKTTSGTWRTSVISGDPAKGTGILNNRLYIGEVVWGRTKWTRSAQNSELRMVEVVDDPKEWVVKHDRRLQIVDRPLWDRVKRLQEASAAKGANIRRALSANGGKGPGPVLGTILVCPCGSNYIANGPYYFECAAVRANACKVNRPGVKAVRFRRDDAHETFFGLMDKELLSPEVIEHERKRFKEFIKNEMNRETVASDANKAARDCDNQIAWFQAQVKAGKVPEAVARPSIDELKRQRQAAVEAVTGNRDKALREALARADALPKLVDSYRGLIRSAMRFESPETVYAARDRVRSLLEDGRIVLAPTADRKQVTGEVRFHGLGRHLIRLGSSASRDYGFGSGGRI